MGVGSLHMCIYLLPLFGTTYRGCRPLIGRMVRPELGMLCLLNKQDQTVNVDKSTCIFRKFAEANGWRLIWCGGVVMRLQHGLSLRSETGGAMGRLYVDLLRRKSVSI